MGCQNRKITLYTDLALELDSVIVSVNYRLAPENPYPKPLNDCYEGLLHITNNAKDFGIDTDRIAVAGGSAGGLLSTSVALEARNKKGPKIRLQVLVYPMLDNRDISESNKEITNIGVWDSGMNHYGFQCYLTGVPESEYRNAVPNLVEDLSYLPKTFIAVGTMDCLRDEGIEYAQKLAASGVQVELHIYPGVTHIFDALIPDSKVAKDFWATRVAASNEHFLNNDNHKNQKLMLLKIISSVLILGAAFMGFKQGWAMFSANLKCSICSKNGTFINRD